MINKLKLFGLRKIIKSLFQNGGLFQKQKKVKTRTEDLKENTSTFKIQIRKQNLLYDCIKLYLVKNTL